MTDLPPHLADKLADFKSALSAVETAFAQANAHILTQAEQDKGKLSDKMRELETTCAHLRSEVSGLKKKVQMQEGVGRKAERHIMAAIDDIDAVLGKMNG